MLYDKSVKCINLYRGNKIQYRVLFSGRWAVAIKKPLSLKKGFLKKFNWF